MLPPTATSTPTQQQLGKVRQQLVKANAQLLDKEREILSLKNEVTALGIQLSIKEEELNDLKKEKCQGKPTVDKKTKRENADLIKQLDECRKALKLQEARIASEKQGTKPVKEDIATACTGTNTEPVKSESDKENDSHVNSESSGKVKYFRGWRNKLSNFYSDKMYYNGRYFPTPEHCFQYEKALFHGNQQAADTILKAKTPGEAKVLSHRLIKDTKPHWDQMRFQIMEDITIARAKQCPGFRSELLKTKGEKLVHNMESDSVWGFGEDGKGQNAMGVILMNVRSQIESSGNTQPRHSTPSYADATQDGASVKMPKSTKVFVVGNSNARNISNHLQELGAQTSSAVFSGAPSWFIRSRLDHSKPSSPPTHVFVHSGDIDVRDMKKDIRQVKREVHQLIDETERQFPDTRILVNTLSTSLPNHVTSKNHPQINEKIYNRTVAVNEAIHRRCARNPCLSAINSSSLELTDAIHFSVRSKKAIALKIANSVNYK